MGETEGRTPGPPHQDAVAGPVAGRVTARRRSLGLSEHLLAKQAGMSASYLRNLLAADSDFDPAGLGRVAAVLGLSRDELVHGPGEPPPGRACPGPNSALGRLAESDCWHLLGTHGVGRVALPGGSGPVVLPVNYAIEARTVVYRTSPDGAAAASTGDVVSFEADHVDDALSRGWSVLVIGTAERVEDPAALDRLAALDAPKPWAGGDRLLWVRIRPESVTGRRITAGRPKGPGTDPGRVR